ncbi:MAG: pyridoxine 5'-phosphate synthase [Gammaproteobacteria bacterium]|nr:pyridoxine 5'-phosphate synthase [Gammaproteobacteria bacterium]
MGQLALSVNLNKVALLRNQRDVGYPSVVRAARSVIAAGADGITVHPRPDERHIRVLDVHELAAMLDVEFNIEGNPELEFMALAERIRPAQCTLVPDAPGQRTSDHGWDLEQDGERLKPLIAKLRDAGIRVSIFMDPDPEAMALAAAVGADRVELYTQSYAAAFGTSEQEAVLQAFTDSAAAAVRSGLGVNAGHDLTLANLPLFVRAIPQLVEVSIGHAFIADALWLGFEETVSRYREALSQA